MKKFLFPSILALSAISLAFAPAPNTDPDPEKKTEAVDHHNDGPTLFTVGGEEVSLDEFEYVYNKNNPETRDDRSREAVEEYLELYINFKLKVKEARELRIDTLPGVQSELDRYRRQLVRSYYDKAVTDRMSEEAYERMKSEVETYHILILASRTASPEDTAEAYNTISKLRNDIANGRTSWESAARQSEDPNTALRGGFLGYITALQIPYVEFEEALYSTKEGEMSPIIRTDVGYHIVKPGETRSASGTVTVAHMLFKPGPDGQTKPAMLRADRVLEQIRGGASFDSLVVIHSDDKTTSNKGGLLPEFGTGRMVPSFEKAAFALKEIGDVSDPVASDYGFHLIKLVDRKPLASYDDLKTEIVRKLQRSGRYDQARANYIERAHSKYGFEQNEAAMETLMAAIDSSLLINTWRGSKAPNPTDVLFKLGKSEYSVAEFSGHMARSQRAYRDQEIPAKVEKLYDQYVEEMTVEYALGRQDEDFRRLLQEYRDGILLFELTEEKVWQKAMRDSTGLESFYASNSSNYMWDERVDASIYQVSDEDQLKKIRKSVKKGTGNDALLVKYNPEGSMVLSIESGLYLPGQNEWVDKADKQLGLSDSWDNGAVKTFVNIREIVSPTEKTLDEAKGYVISDYQELLEDQWVEELRAKYPVEVNDKVLNKMIK